jgi:methylmalonyl-CoA mutase cobalamin-binding subunit
LDQPIPVVIGGSVITDTDKRSLTGVAAAFGPTATPAEIIATIRKLASGNSARDQH